MSSVRFIVRGEKRNLVPVYVRLLDSKVDIRCKTGLTINPKEWNGKGLKQRILSEDDELFLSRLNGLKSFLESENRFYVGNKDKAWLSGLVNRFYNIKDRSEDTLNGYISNYIQKAQFGEIKNRSAINFVPGTIRKWKGTQRILNAFQGIYNDKDSKAMIKNKKPFRPHRIIDFDDITTGFYNEFVAFLSSEGYKVNMIGRVVKDVKYFMIHSLKEKKHNNRDFETFTGFSEDSHAIYLTLDEVEKIYNAKIRDKKTEMARDAFICLCETALRISDYKKISLSVKGMFIHIYQGKTSDKVVIPLTKRMESILNKYNGTLPVIHENYVNELIKTVAFQVGFKDTITWPTQKFGKRFETSAPKWKLISCHTGRRTAATNMYKAGIPVIDIMKITGHRTEKSFLKYIRISEEETAERLSHHPYFSQLKAVD